MSAPLGTLYDHGAHFVLCGGKDGKAPIWKGWQAHRPSLEVVEHHAGNGRSIGIVPASIGTSALDVDHGDPGELFAQWPARAVVPSRRAGGRHGYYDDEHGRGNHKWDVLGAGGEVRSARGFLVLYGDAPEKLATALTRPGRYPFPDSLFEAAGMVLPVQYAPIEQGPAIVAGSPTVLPMLEVIREGDRNTSLFDVVRWWAYSQDRGAVLADWCEAVLDYALQHNERFPPPRPELPHTKDGPLPAEEVGKLAYYVATWTWSGHGAIDHAPVAQSRRGVVSGLVRRGIIPSKAPSDKGKRRTGRHRTEIRDRDHAILQDRADGMSLRAIAAKHGLTHPAVLHVLRRDAPLL